MTTNDKHNGLVQDLVKQSLLTLDDSQFQDATMKKILTIHRRRRMFDNLLLGTFIFITVDTFMVLACWILRLDVFKILSHVLKIPESYLPHTDQLKNILIHSTVLPYGLVAFAMLMILLVMIESKVDFPGNRK
jgi:hypothetical protein